MNISEKEHRIISHLARDTQASQRSISNSIGISLGMTNLLLKRLISKGYVKASAMDRRKLRYALTPRGFSQQARRSYSFVLRTIQTLNTMQRQIERLVSSEVGSGRRRFAVVGEGEIAALFEMVLNRFAHKGVTWFRTQGYPKTGVLCDAIFLIKPTSGPPQGPAAKSVPVVDVVERLARIAA